jgi:oxygen-independent coproporphyrinogen-3 oxidase
MVAMPTSLYVHIPFCRHRCAYCDFNTYAGLEPLMPAYLEALAVEIQGIGRLAKAEGRPPSVHTVFFGGGTPSLLSAYQLRAILDQIRQSFELTQDAEITLEANPGTVDPEGLLAMRRLGVNRLSLGMQSSHAEELRLLERQHGMGEVRQAIDWARKAGFDNLNLDLIYGLPDQSMASWRASLSQAIALGPEHLSLYALSLEFGTPMLKRVKEGELSRPDPDAAADMYEWSSDELEKAGFLQYEISNWARPESNGQPKGCQHNLQIWRNGEYLGFGAGAHGFAAGTRTRGVRSPRSYIARLEAGDWRGPYPLSPATVWYEPQPAIRRAEDMMILGLRLTREGVSEQAYAEAIGRPMQADFGEPIRALTDNGLLELSDGRVRLTPRGRLLGNRVFQAFLISA